MRRGLIGFGALLLGAVLFAPCTRAQEIHGRLELQDLGSFAGADSFNALEGARDANDLLGNLRLTWEPSWGAWSVAVHYVVASDFGDGAGLARNEASLLPAPPPTWFNLTDTFENHGKIESQQTIDRLSIAYSTPDFVLRLGRQALTLGGGLVFRPMDLFDPFAPNATDTEFKPGTDMVYGQWLFADGSDLQMIVVPRPQVEGGRPTADASSFAAYYRTTLGDMHAGALVARDRGDWTVAAELSGPLSGASWDLELVPTIENSGTTRVSALANISDAVTLLDRNATIFAEFYRNGFGVTQGGTDFTELPPDLADRLARGQIFALRRDYLAAGTSWEWSPLLTLSPTFIADLDDRSLYFLASATYSLADDLTLIGGVQLPAGAHASEFGGLRLSPSEPATIGPAPQVYLQLRRYF